MSTETNNCRLCVVNLRDRVPKVLVPAGIESEYPVWSPKGRWILISLLPYPHDQPSVVLLVDTKTGGSQQIMLDKNLGFDGLPENVAWSPDGRSILFIVGQPPFGPRIGLYIYRIRERDTITLLPLVPGADTRVHPSWSPDGRRIAYITEHSKPRQEFDELIVLDIVSKSEKVLFRPAEPATLLNPTWSPDGHRLVFWLERLGKRYLMMLPVDKPELVDRLSSASIAGP